MTEEEKHLYGNFFAACREKFTGLNPRTEFKQVFKPTHSLTYIRNTFLGIHSEKHPTFYHIADKFWFGLAILRTVHYPKKTFCLDFLKLCMRGLPFNFTFTF